MRMHCSGPALAKFLLAAALLGGTALAAQAQQGPVAKAELDTNIILIGDQAKFTLSITYRADQGPTAVTWPVIGDTITGKIPVLGQTPVDTVLPEKETDPFIFRQTRTLTITSWDSGYWAIPPFRFVVNEDTLATDPLLLTVETVQVDTTKAFRDIKEIYNVPFSLLAWLKQQRIWFAVGLATLVLVLLLLRFLRNRKRKPSAPAPPPPAVPAHITALKALEALQQKHLWQAGKVKAFHSELTDILRLYVQERYGVPAMERTTDELLSGLRFSAMPRQYQEKLAPLLRQADMVKFAKWNPLPDENKQAMTSAVELVSNTAPGRDEGKPA